MTQAQNRSQNRSQSRVDPGMSLLARLLIAVLVVYRHLVSPLLGPHCRFHPTCSRYAMLAIRSHGALRGSWLALKRVGRCHPLHEGGLDPVP